MFILSTPFVFLILATRVTGGEAFFESVGGYAAKLRIAKTQPASPENGDKLSARESKELSSIGVKESLGRRDLLSAGRRHGRNGKSRDLWFNEHQK